MAALEQYPVHVRRKIALGITAGIALILVVVMIISYTTARPRPKNNGATTKIGQFYATVISSAQSYFGNKDATIDK